MPETLGPTRERRRTREQIDGSSETQAFQRTDRQPPRPRREDPQALVVLSAMQHGRAAAHDLPEVRALRGPEDRGDGVGAADL